MLRLNEDGDEDRHARPHPREKKGLRAGLQTVIGVKGKVALGWTLVPRGLPPPPSPAFRAVGWGRRLVDAVKLLWTT